MININKQALTDEAISKAFAGTNFGRDDFKNILAETVIDAAAGWRCGYTATTICTQLGLLTPKGCASALGLRFISEHVQLETKRLKDELEAAEKRIAELEWDSEQAECVNLCLNELGVPKAKDEGQLSLWGRVVAYGEISATERDELRAFRGAGIITKVGE